jgi:hypothetical protein
MITNYHNPALYQEPRNQPLTVTPPIPRESLLNWLEGSGRFHSNEIEELQDYLPAEELESFLESDVYAEEEEEKEID